VRSSAWLAAGLVLFLAGCGYVGPVLPPSPELPQAVRDLRAVERGDQIVITFSTPARTTDNLPVRQFSEIDLRLGPAPVPFDFDRWAASAARSDVEPPVPTDPENPLAVVVSKNVPAADWVGKRVAIAVRTAVKRHDHYSSWSNRVLLDVLPPLLAPEPKPESTARGVLLRWSTVGPGAEYRVYRKGGTDIAPLLLGTTGKPEYLDTTSQFETPYAYTIVSVHGAAESLASRPVSITTRDVFGPAAPTGVAALAGPNSIEVSWQRSPEPDLRGYFVFRSTNGGPFERVGALLTIPAFSDPHVEHGKNYRYKIGAVDQKDNPSEQSAAVEVNY
jgi:hypothetical protein